MEDPVKILGIIAVVCVLFGGVPLVSPKFTNWYLTNTMRGRASARVLGEERATRLIRFAICPIMVVSGLAAGVYAIMLATGKA